MLTEKQRDFLVYFFMIYGMFMIMVQLSTGEQTLDWIELHTGPKISGFVAGSGIFLSLLVILDAAIRLKSRYLT